MFSIAGRKSEWLCRVQFGAEEMSNVAGNDDDKICDTKLTGESNTMGEIFIQNSISNIYQRRKIHARPHSRTPRTLYFTREQ